MKKKLAVLAIIMSIFLQGTFSYAYPLIFEDVKLDKEWSIEFTKPVDGFAITPENVGILDFNNKRIAADIEVDSDNPSIVRIKSSKPYIPKQEYIIYVKSDMKAQDGTSLGSDISVMFVTKNDPFYLAKDEPVNKKEYMEEGAYRYETVTAEKVADNAGYEHTNAIGAKFTNEASQTSYPTKNMVYREYYLGGEYALFSGKLLINGDNRYMDGQGDLKVYADDKLVYSSEQISAGFMPVDISADVNGADKLRIEFGVEPQEVSQGVFFEAYIGSARLTK